MTQFRVSKNLSKKGVPPELQGLIFFTCLNVCRIDKKTQDKILNLCIAVAGEDYQALYKFLTDRYVNYAYIYTHFGVGEKLLRKYKRDFYVKWKDR